MSAERPPSDDVPSDAREQAGFPDTGLPDTDDDRLERLLRSTYGANAPSEGFVQSLLSRLDQQRLDQQLSRRTAGRSAYEPVETNGYHGGAKVITLGEQMLAERRRQARGRWGRRLTILGTAAAAMLLVAVSLWSMRPAYGWSDMLRALGETSWVQAFSTDSGTIVWYSNEHGVFAWRDSDGATFEDARQGVRADYAASEQVIRTAVLDATLDWQANLVQMLVGDTEGKISLVDNPLVVAESWTEMESSAVAGRSIELRVTLQTGVTAADVTRLAFKLDPKTHLPREARRLGAGEHDTVRFAFNYPTQGPDTIYALDVPREVRVVGLEKQSHDTAAADVATQVAVAEPTVRVAKQMPSVAAPGGEVVLEQVDELVIAGLDTKPAAVEDLAQAAPAERFARAEPVAPVRRQMHELGEPLPTDQLVAKIDDQLAALWESQAIQPAEPASDEEFVRRVYLDLTGRIPMVSEVYNFLDDQSPDRRERLVDDLLASRDHATHLAAVWRTMLLPDGVNTGPYGGTQKFDQWLADRFGQNEPYDQLVRELLSAEGRVSDSGPLLFYATLKLNPEELAGKTSRVFLGMRMECAQCHDHPFDETISQYDFWGFAAYFAQISRPQGKMETTSSVLRVKDNRHGEVMIPESDEVVAPHLPRFHAPEVIDAEATRRAQMVAWLTDAQNERFARATVNRVWEHLFGRGLVMPVDDMRDDNTPVCPEVLDALSRDFAASGFDLRRLIRTLVLSRAYQLSSRSATDEPSQALVFARMNMKSFTADQLYDCIAVATQNANMLGGTGDGSLARYDNAARQQFIDQFRAPPGERTNYAAGIPQALSLMHGTLVQGATELGTSGLMQSLQAPFFTDAQRLETLFLATLSRYPNEAERDEMLKYLTAAAPAQRQTALGDVLWALLNSAEFTFNH